MTALRRLPPLVKTLRSGVIRQQAKKVDPLYVSSEHRAWRIAVCSRAAWQCEAVEDGRRCEKAAPANRMFADHIREVADEGDRFDPANGQCLCGRHHTLKTARARAARLVARPRGVGV
jgi:5-methylcytosine-specific restriction enzyme A